MDGTFLPSRHQQENFITFAPILLQIIAISVNLLHSVVKQAVQASSRARVYMQPPQHSRCVYIRMPYLIKKYSRDSMLIIIDG
jgi:hypothetical protein